MAPADDGPGELAIAQAASGHAKGPAPHLPGTGPTRT
jgi:hypothetical protein